MPHRTKQEAEMRLSMGVARIAMRQGQTPEEAVQAIKSHLAVMASLDRPQLQADDEVVVKKLTRME